MPNSLRTMTRDIMRRIEETLYRDAAPAPEEQEFQARIHGQFSSDDSTVVSVGGVLTPEMIEDAAVRAAQNSGRPDMVVNPSDLDNFRSSMRSMSQQIQEHSGIDTWAYYAPNGSNSSPLRVNPEGRIGFEAEQPKRLRRLR